MPEMLDYVISNFYPEITHKEVADRNSAMFDSVVERTARMVALWQSVGFCHGVLNTDNLSILGLTIDYGPFGFMEHFDPKHICNHSDDKGRYVYEAQPEICHWNLNILRRELEPFMRKDSSEAALKENYWKHYTLAYNTLMQ